MSHFYLKKQREAAQQVKDLLAKPPIPADNMYSDGECFDPWDLFPSIYGSYSGEFDALALDVLDDLKNGEFTRRDLASEIFREMLCVANLCEYGTSPRVCFPTEEFKALLPDLIRRWDEYAMIKWQYANVT